MNVVVPSFKNKAVWHSLCKHINYLLSLNSPIVVYIVTKEEIDEAEVKSPFIKDVGVVLCRNRRTLVRRLIKSNDDSIYLGSVIDVVLTLPVKFVKSKKLCLWVQGIIPEEDYLQYHSRVRYYAFSFLERISLRLCDKFVFVSQGMKDHFVKKYRRRFENCIIVPCISELEYKGIEKEKHSYVYIGGMAPWQMFNEVLKMFNQICSLIPESKLYIATFSQAKAGELLNDFLEPKFRSNVMLLSINNRDEIAHFLSRMEYGFLLRDNIPINHVSSPIKLAEYLSCGVNPIMSSSIKSYAGLISEFDCGIVVDDYLLSDRQILKDAVPFNAIQLNNEEFLFERQVEKYRNLLNK